jgi:hypothetical protein
MKNVIDYLIENKKFEGIIGNANIKIELCDDVVVIIRDECVHTFRLSDDIVAEYEIQDILEANKIEVRFCEICGKPYDKGFTAGNGEWYCCEECFEATMDEDYGKGKWRPSEQEGEYEGWYEYLNEENEWEDTGVFYTEWN